MPNPFGKRDEVELSNNKLLFNADPFTKIIFAKYSVPDVFANQGLTDRGLYAADDQRLISQLYAVRQNQSSYLSVAAISVEAIARHADPLTQTLHAGLIELGLKPMAPRRTAADSGIIAFQHPQSAAMHAALERANIHVMHQAGRVRMAVHGYNTSEDIEFFLATLRDVMATL